MPTSDPPVTALDWHPGQAVHRSAYKQQDSIHTHTHTKTGQPKEVATQQAQGSPSWQHLSSRNRAGLCKPEGAVCGEGGRAVATQSTCGGRGGSCKNGQPLHHRGLLLKDVVQPTHPGAQPLIHPKQSPHPHSTGEGGNMRIHTDRCRGHLLHIDAIPTILPRIAGHCNPMHLAQLRKGLLTKQGHG